MSGPNRLSQLFISNRKLNSTNVALEVAVVDGSGAQVTSFGSGGTQYTEGDTDTTITGTAALTEGPSDTVAPLQSNAAKQLLVAASGDVAHDAADSGNPVKVGGKAATSLPTVVAANDRVNLIADVYGRPFVRSGVEGPASAYWDAQHLPAANTQATITKAAVDATSRNVCTGFTVAISGGSTAPAAVQLSVALIDGASAGATYLWRATIALPAVAGALSAYVRSHCWFVGSVNTAMTLEFSAAGGANTIESVTMEGTTVAE